ncbi:MAG: peptide chain release factor N(5)-glutamine methyltransferase [Candidatus Omnitrophota bacterium]
MNYSETIPVQYEEGKAAFMGMDVKVDRRVLIPRPETELLVTVVSDLCREKSWGRPFILDVGTGSGIISLGLTKEIPDCRMIASDVSGEALSVARENLKHFDQEDRVKLLASDMFSAFGPEYEGVFDCIVSNPPYVSQEDYPGLDAWVKAEPRIALYAGHEGMDYLRVIAEKSAKFLKRGGFCVVECGYDQAKKVKESFSAYGFTDIGSYRDFNDHERVIVGWKHG